MKLHRYLLAFILSLVTATFAQAQTGACPTSTTLAVNPTGWVCVTPNTDYMTTATAADGVTIVPVVVRMDLLLFDPSKTNTATDAPTQTINIGKPTRNTNNAVWVQVAQLATLPTGQQYKARAVAVGQPLTTGGTAQVSARSPESNPFMRPVPVPAPLAPTAVSVPD